MFYKFMKYFVAWPLVHILFRVEVHNKPDHLEGPLILCGNHQSEWDPVLLALQIKERVHFIGKKELFRTKIGAWFFGKLGVIPIDRKTSDMESIRASLNVLKEDKILGIFPEGTRVKEVSLDNLKEGVGFLAQRGKADILPAYIESTFKPFSRVKITFREVIPIEEFADVKRAERNHAIALRVFESIYQDTIGNEE